MNSRRWVGLMIVIAAAGRLFATPVESQVEFVLVEKRSEWTASGNGVVVAAPDDPEHFSAPFGFRVQVEGTNLSGLSPAPTFTIPGGSGLTPPLAYDAEGENWVYRPAFGSQSLLDGAYANGGYGVTVQDTTLHLDLDGDAYPAPPVPVISGGTWSNGVLYIDAAQPLTISTGAFVGFGTTGVLNHINLSIFGPNATVDIESFSPNPYVSGDVSTDSLSHAFDGGDLVSGASYKVQIEFNTIVDLSDELEGAIGVALYTSRLTFDMQTLAAVPEPATYAAWLGVATLGLAAVRRLKRRAV